ncbi:hypothetical protein TTHERM_00035660 (macronuclear) [Tetrahymena thermophila SB210]|uniref:Uncharacterized protein n=1 Tax=Tetrahymena thermophila (strain SB210) TaxID=312017 RepID=Q22MF4_TETTS|nr:hypothetical protein TTHERM_00035660 [Tetrahymena thermophila SB210]EAR86480.2 hypothetical protein TTHERM_00035660 [Tetrahymena thermophila SB210]|eukprot:XP_977066.2 hypothetical protein TTHERM_00035660 [Tetrahymena thermophila SB210]
MNENLREQNNHSQQNIQEQNDLRNSKNSTKNLDANVQSSKSQIKDQDPTRKASIEDYSQDIQISQIITNKNIINKQIDQIKNDMGIGRKLSALSEEGSMQGTPQSRNKKKQRDQEFDLKFKRLGFGSIEYKEQDLQKSVKQKQNVDGYVIDLQDHLDNSMMDMRGFLDRRYYLLVNYLQKVREKLQVYFEELKNMEGKINRDQQVQVMMQQLENYQTFSENLKRDIEIMKVNIKKEEEQALGLYQIYKYRKDQLSSKNRENLNYSKQIIELQNMLEDYQKQRDMALKTQPFKINILNDFQNNTHLDNTHLDITQKFNASASQPSLNESIQSIPNKNNQNTYLNIPTNNQSQAKAQTSRISPNVQSKRNSSSTQKYAIQNDPLAKIEAYCGTLKMVKRNHSISMKTLQNSQLNNIQNLSQISHQQVQENYNDSSIISKKLQNNNNSKSYITLNPNASKRILSQSIQLQQGQQKNNNYSFLNPQDFQNTEIAELQQINKQIEKYRVKNLNIKNKLIQNCNNFFELYSLFEDCLDLERKNLEKSQRKVLKDQGLQGSLLFEMQKAELFLTELDLKQKIQKIKFKPKLQDREMRYVVHDTLKSMLDNKLQKYKKEYQKEDFQLDWYSFKDTTPVQVIGLMSLKPQVFEESKSEFEKKARLIKDKIQKNKILSSILDNKSSQTFI